MPATASLTGSDQKNSGRPSSMQTHGPVHRAMFVVFTDIDAVKHESSDADYKYGSAISIQHSLTLLIRQYSLQSREFEGKQRPLRDLEATTLEKRLYSFLSRSRRSCKSLASSKAMWLHGSSALREAAFENIRKTYLSYTEHSNLPIAGSFPVVHFHRQVQDATSSLGPRHLALTTERDRNETSEPRRDGSVLTDLDKMESWSASPKPEAVPPARRYEGSGSSSTKFVSHESNSSGSPGCHTSTNQPQLSPNNRDCLTWDSSGGEDRSSSGSDVLSSVRKPKAKTRTPVEDTAVSKREAATQRAEERTNAILASLLSTATADRPKRRASVSSHRFSLRCRSRRKTFLPNQTANASLNADMISHIGHVEEPFLGPPANSTQSESLVTTLGSQASRSSMEHADIVIPQHAVKASRVQDLARSSQSSASSDFDLNNLKTIVSDISRQLQDLVLNFFISISLPRTTRDSGPFACSDSRDLHALIRKCWGTDCGQHWKEMSSFDSMRALVASFVHSRVLMDGHALQPKVYEQLGLSVHPEIIFGPLLPDPESTRVARKRWDSLIAEKIVASPDNARFIRDISISLSEELIVILRPYISQLINTAKDLHPDPCLPDEHAWLPVFRHESSQLMEASLRLKIDLTRSSSEYTFVWPNTGEVLDSSYMLALHRTSPDRQYQVAYTLFPSIQTKGRLGLRKIRHAEVVSMPLCELLSDHQAESTALEARHELEPGSSARGSYSARSSMQQPPSWDTSETLYQHRDHANQSGPSAC